MLRIDVITIFPELFEGFTQTSILGAALERGLLEIQVHDLRSYTEDRHRKVDDEPYGGGPGMVMKPEPLVAAIEAWQGRRGRRERRGSCCSRPQGGPSISECGRTGSLELQRLVLVCGRYEGVDQRAIELAVDEEISIGDYVLSGGEVPAMVVIEAVSRLLPGPRESGVGGHRESFPEGTVGRAPVHAASGVSRPRGSRGAALRETMAKIESWRGQNKPWNEQERRRPDLLPSEGRLPGPWCEETEHAIPWT